MERKTTLYTSKKFASSIQNSNIIDKVVEEVAARAESLLLQPMNHTIGQRRLFIEGGREKGHDTLFEKYFSENPIYPEHYSRTRYHMGKLFFERLMNQLVATNEFFQQKPNAAGHLGMCAIQKCTAAMRVLAYDTTFDLHNEYLGMGGQLIRKPLKRFVEGIISNFSDENYWECNEHGYQFLGGLRPDVVFMNVDEQYFQFYSHSYGTFTYMTVERILTDFPTITWGNQVGNICIHRKWMTVKRFEMCDVL